MLLELCLTLIAIVFVLFAAFCSWLTYTHSLYAHIPSKPRGGFLMGHLPSIQKESINGFFHSALEKWFNELGPVICIWLGTAPFVMVRDPAIAKDITVTKDLPKASMIYRMLQKMFKERSMGTGLVTILDKEAWKHRRQMINPAFHRTYLKSLVPNFNKSSNILMGKLRSLADGKTVVDMLIEMHKFALDVITKAAFGLNLNMILDENDQFMHAADVILSGVDFKVKNPFYKIDFRTFPKQRNCDSSAKYIRDYGARCIAERKKALAEGKPLPNDIMSIVVERAVADGRVTDEELIDEYVTFAIAGQETTANMLSFLLLEVLTNPDILSRLTTEIDDVVGDRDEIEFEDLGKLKIMGQCIKETLRLYPPAAAVDRDVPEDIEYGGYKIPKGTMLGVSIFSIHRHSDYWPNPSVFNPDRWESEAAENPGVTQAYMPFSAGPRNCIGRFFAEFEAKVVLAKLLRDFEMKLVPNTKIEISQSGTLRPKGGVPVTLTLKRN